MKNNVAKHFDNKETAKDVHLASLLIFRWKTKKNDDFLMLSEYPENFLLEDEHFQIWTTMYYISNLNFEKHRPHHLRNTLHAIWQFLSHNLRKKWNRIFSSKN